MREACPASQQPSELEALVQRIVDAAGEGADVQALEAEVNERVWRIFSRARQEKVGAKNSDAGD